MIASGKWIGRGRINYHAFLDCATVGDPNVVSGVGWENPTNCLKEKYERMDMDNNWPI